MLARDPSRDAIAVSDGLWVASSAKGAVGRRDGLAALAHPLCPVRDSVAVIVYGCCEAWALLLSWCCEGWVRAFCVVSLEVLS